MPLTYFIGLMSGKNEEREGRQHDENEMVIKVYYIHFELYEMVQIIVEKYNVFYEIQR